MLSFIYFLLLIVVLIGWVWLGEWLGLLILVGGVVIVVGVVLVNMKWCVCFMLLVVVLCEF